MVRFMGSFKMKLSSSLGVIPHQAVDLFWEGAEVITWHLWHPQNWKVPRELEQVIYGIAVELTLN